MRSLITAINNAFTFLTPIVLAIAIGAAVYIILFDSWENGDFGREFDYAPPVSAATEVDR